MSETQGPSTSLAAVGLTPTVPDFAEFVRDKVIEKLRNMWFNGEKDMFPMWVEIVSADGKVLNHPIRNFWGENRHDLLVLIKELGKSLEQPFEIYGESVNDFKMQRLF